MEQLQFSPIDVFPDFNVEIKAIALSDIPLACPLKWAMVLLYQE